MDKRVILAPPLLWVASTLFGCGGDPKPPSPTPPPPPPFKPSCLCTFDIDRTLTGNQAQGNSPPCGTNEVLPNIYDTAYDKGKLSLSEAGQSLAGTFCESCYIGIVSAGGADVDKYGPVNDMRTELIKRFSWVKSPAGLLATPGQGIEWTGPFGQQYKPHGQKVCTPDMAQSPIVLGCKDGSKQEAVKGILDWMKKNYDIDIFAGHVWHFDDRANNIEPFRGTGFNARQISCDPRDDPSWATNKTGQLGLCGATRAEIVNETGVVLCPDASRVVV